MVTIKAGHRLNFTTIPLPFHIVPAMTKAFIILWGEVFYSLFTISLCPPSIAWSSLNLWPSIAWSSLNLWLPWICFSTGKRQIIGDYIPWYNDNQCTVFSYATTCICHINSFFERLLGNKSFLWPAVLTEAEAKCFGDCLCIDHSHHSLIMESEGLWNVGLQIWTHLVCYKRRIYQLQHESFFYSLQLLACAQYWDCRSLPCCISVTNSQLSSISVPSVMAKGT